MIPFSISIALAAVSAFLYFLGIIVYRTFFHPLRNYDGPWHAKFSRAAWTYHTIIGDLPQYTCRLHDKYGDVLRIGYDQLSYINSQAWTDIYGHRSPSGGGNLPKDLRYRREEPNGVGNIIVANEADHRRMRRLQAHAFSEKALNAQEEVLESYASKLIERLREKASSADTNVVNIVKWYNYTTFDLLGDLAFGQSFGCLDSDVLHPWITVILHFIKEVSFDRVSRELWWPLSRLVIWLGSSEGEASSSLQHAGFSYAKARERIAQGSTNRADFMSYMLKHNDEKGMTTKEIESNSSLLIIAGSETTATFLSGTTYKLLMNPGILTKIQTLIRTTFATSEDINILALSQMTYLTAILEEGLRTYPPVPIGLPRLTTSEGSTICDRYVPPNTIVSIPNLAAYMSERNFKNPQRFEPQRWEKDDESRGIYKDDDRKVLQPFSFGPRNCIGRNLAYAEMRLILAKVLWNFDLELMPESRNWDDQKIYALWEKKPLMVRLVAREV